jgi:hypothetical protein
MARGSPRLDIMSIIGARPADVGTCEVLAVEPSALGPTVHQLAVQRIDVKAPPSARTAEPFVADERGLAR